MSNAALCQSIEYRGCNSMFRFRLAPDAWQLPPVNLPPAEIIDFLMKPLSLYANKQDKVGTHSKQKPTWTTE